MNPDTLVLKICKAYQKGLELGLIDDVTGFRKYVKDATLSVEEIRANDLGWQQGKRQYLDGSFQ